MKKTTLLLLLFSAAGSAVLCAKTHHSETTIIRISATPSLDDQEEMSEHEAEVASAVEIEENSRVWQWINKAGSETAATVIRLKRFMVVLFKRMKNTSWRKSVTKKRVAKHA